MKKMNLVLENGQNVQIEVDGNLFSSIENETKINLSNKALFNLCDFQRNDNHSLDYHTKNLSNAVTVLMRQLVHYDLEDKEAVESITIAAHHLSLLHEEMQSFRTEKE